MIILEIKQQLYLAYLAMITLQDDLKHGYDAVKDNPLALATHLAEGFILWVEDQKRQSSNEVLQAMIRFVERS
jgi:hypothetical protein